MANYTPPLTITSRILNLIAEISEQLGRYSERENKAQALRLRRANKIRSIHGSLAIEGNTMSLEQITAVLDGKPVIATAREVQEVKNALVVYEKFNEFDAFLQADLLRAHELLMLGLLDSAGHFRSSNVGVMSGRQVIHMAPPASQVLRLMEDLFSWVGKTDFHPLIASSVFHYEFEFIHPFADGKGRMGRLWQNVILADWNPLFANLPIESMVYRYQQEYYQAIQATTGATDAAPFVEFMLGTISKTFSQLIQESELGIGVGKSDENSVKSGDYAYLAGTASPKLSETQLTIIELMQQEPEITIQVLAGLVGISTTAIENHIRKLRQLGLVARVGGRKQGHWQVNYSYSYL